MVLRRRLAGGSTKMALTYSALSAVAKKPVAGKSKGGQAPVAGDIEPIVEITGVRSEEPWTVEDARILLRIAEAAGRAAADSTDLSDLSDDDFIKAMSR